MDRMSGKKPEAKILEVFLSKKAETAKKYVAAKQVE